MASHPLDKQTAAAGCNSPHDWLMSLAIDLAICGGENGTNGHHFPGFSEDVACACHFVATLPPYRSAASIGYASKETI